MLPIIIFSLKVIPYILVICLAIHKRHFRLAALAIFVLAMATANMIFKTPVHIRDILALGFTFMLVLHVLDLDIRRKI